MNVYVDADPLLKITGALGAQVPASDTDRSQSPRPGVVVLTDPAAREKAIMTWLMRAAMSGTLFVVAAVFTTVINWSVLGWRNFWLALCITGFIGLIVSVSKACARFEEPAGTED